MPNFFENPILNSPYKEPKQHWELKEGKPSNVVINKRRKADFITPIPKPKKLAGQVGALHLNEGYGLSNEEQDYTTNATINRIRDQISVWRNKPKTEWRVTPETARLLDHWRNGKFNGKRPFFCQIEAAETIIWLTEVAPEFSEGRKILDQIAKANNEANPEIYRMALKLATGAGKTTVMAMLIAWQTINSVRYKNSKKFTRGFLIIAPGLTIKDRLRVLFPNDPDSYFKNMQLVPADMVEDLQKAKIVVTNYHAFKRREIIELSNGTRQLLIGPTGNDLNTLETDGQLVQRVAGSLQGLKNIWVINDEAHHCYREKQQDLYEDLENKKLSAEEKQELKKSKDAARLWISGIEIVKRQIGVERVIDLSATPFFLRGSGYAEGTIFHWTVSDFSLMDAIECGIVKLPRVPISDNHAGNTDVYPVFRNLWENIRSKMPKKGRHAGAKLDPQALPTQLQTALLTLYNHYEKTYALWEEKRIGVPPCFIIVCNNTASSKLVYDFISGYHLADKDGVANYIPGKLSLFRNYDNEGRALRQPSTLLIDSEQLESGDELSPEFKEAAQLEIERFKEEIIERTGDRAKAENLKDADLLREVMNTVGKKGQLGGQIKCVVSVSMLTEGWDANTVTHILGVRAFGTQLLCEQVVGRALRRLNYELNEEDKFNVEYADIFGIPFDFSAEPVPAAPTAPKPLTTVKAINPEREHLEIRFPNVVSYTFKRASNTKLTAIWTDDSRMALTPDMVGATETKNAGIIGEAVDLTLDNLDQIRFGQILMELTSHVWLTKLKDPDDVPEIALFGQLRQVCKHWLENYLECKGETKLAMITYKSLADRAAEKIINAINRDVDNSKTFFPILDPYNPIGSTKHVQFITSMSSIFETDPQKCHINYVVYESNWEAAFCELLERMPQVKAYVKNNGLGFQVPYVYEGEAHNYMPDFILKIEDSNGKECFMVVEIKGEADDKDSAKHDSMITYWIPAVNNAKKFGSWAFIVLKEPYDFKGTITAEIESFVRTSLTSKN